MKYLAKAEKISARKSFFYIDENGCIQYNLFCSLKRRTLKLLDFNAIKQNEPDYVRIRKSEIIRCAIVGGKLTVKFCEYKNEK